MSPLERRTPLGRGKPLKPGTTPLRRTPLKAAAPTAKPRERRAARRRDTGPTQTVRDIVWERSGGRCEMCQRPLAGIPWSRHHRNPRRMGGTRRAGVNAPSNLLAICGTGTTGCHAVVEHNRRASLDAGLLLHAGDDPRLVAVELAIGLVWLDDDGMYLLNPPAPTSPGAP